MPEANAVANTENGGGENNTTDAVTNAKSVSELPEWAQAELSRARNDAASYRTKLRETEAARDNLEKSFSEESEKVKTLTTDLDDLKLNSAKFDVALDAYQVDGKQVKAFADRLRGASVEELNADAKSIMETFNVTPGSKPRAVDRSAGLGNDKPPTAEDAFGQFVGDKLGWGK